MSREDLIELLAHEIHGMRYPEAWERSDDNRRGWCRADAATMLPGVVAFVGDWLERELETGPAAAALWRKQMRA